MQAKNSHFYDEDDDDTSNKYTTNNQDDEDDRKFVKSIFKDEESLGVVVQNISTKRPLSKRKKIGRKE